MKCWACGYKHKEPVLKDGEPDFTRLESDGEEPFDKIINSFHMKKGSGDLDEAYLFACPRCGTVRMEKW